MIEIRLGARRWTLAPGSPLTFGRGSDRDVRFGDDPEDLLVSRHAGTLTATGAEVLVRNDSRSQQYYLTPMPGRERAVGPGMTVGLPDSRMHLVVLGRHDARYELVLARRVPAQRCTPVVVPAPGTPTAGPPADLAPRERRMLAALCEPLLRYAGEDARPASHAEIARRLGLGSPEYVRRVLGELRDRLSTADGVPRLNAGPGDAGRGYAEALADWALRSGVVTSADLPVLDTSR